MTTAQTAADTYYLAYHRQMMSGAGPVRYLLVPTDWAGRGILRCKSIMESGQPAADLYVNRHGICPVRHDNGLAECPTDGVMAATLRARATEGGHPVPDIAPAPVRPAWGQWAY